MVPSDQKPETQFDGIFGGSGLQPLIVLGDNGVLYGHELVRDIAEGRKDAEDVTIFRDVQLAAFQALLWVLCRYVSPATALHTKRNVIPDAWRSLKRLNFALPMRKKEIKSAFLRSRKQALAAD
jgi:hypothetical protein